MTDHPIIFSAPMVRALLDGRKTMTRRFAGAYKPIYPGCDDLQWKPSPWQRSQPGDRLWLREAFAILPRNCYALPKTLTRDGSEAAYYRADFDRSGKPAWRSPIHMPRWASRLTLIVTATRIERVQEISEDDARAEGVTAPVLPRWSSMPYRSA